MTPPAGITEGSDGALWFVEIAAGQIGRLPTDRRIRDRRYVGTRTGTPTHAPTPGMWGLRAGEAPQAGAANDTNGQVVVAFGLGPPSQM